MHVTHLSLTDFRSYAQVDVPLDAGVTAFIGPNGQGKTNLIEAVGYVAALASHRVATDLPLVRLGCERAIIRADIARDGRSTRVELELNPGKSNRARINRAPVPRPREVLGLLRTVLFAPEDLALVKGDPGERRVFLDGFLVARAPRFAGVRQDYERVLKQRSALLKSAAAVRRSSGSRSADLSTLDVWDTHLARTGAELIAARLELVAAVAPLVEKGYAQIAGSGGPAVIEYRSSLGDHLDTTDRAELAEVMLARLVEVRDTEIERGVCLVGPHRDDLVLKLGPLPAKGYASHGESWSYALALRLASYELLCADGGEPVLILDDVFAELDTNRRRRLAELADRAEQVLVTAAVPHDVPGELIGVRYDVAEGEVRRSR